MQHKSQEAEFETPSERTVNLFKWGYFDVESGELIKEGDKWTSMQTDVMMKAKLQNPP